jgi:hypothetical protein
MASVWWSTGTVTAQFRPRTGASGSQRLAGFTLTSTSLPSLWKYRTHSVRLCCSWRGPVAASNVPSSCRKRCGKQRLVRTNEPYSDRRYHTVCPRRSVHSGGFKEECQPCLCSSAFAAVPLQQCRMLLLQALSITMIARSIATTEFRSADMYSV